jgi:hypothetical protein
MRTLGKWFFLILAIQSLYSENSITIIGDIDDGLLFQSGYNFIHNFFFRWETKARLSRDRIQRSKSNNAII